MASAYSASSPPNNLLLYPRYIEWDAPTSAGDEFEIDDGAGNILFKYTAPANGQTQYLEVASGVRWPSSWQLVTLDSGTLYIWFTT